MEAVLQKKLEEDVSSFELIVPYLQKFCNLNDGAMVEHEVDENGCMQQLFVCPSFMNSAIRHACPINQNLQSIVPCFLDWLIQELILGLCFLQWQKCRLSKTGEEQWQKRDWWCIKVWMHHQGPGWGIHEEDVAMFPRQTVHNHGDYSVEDNRHTLHVGKSILSFLQESACVLCQKGNSSAGISVTPVEADLESHFFAFLHLSLAPALPKWIITINFVKDMILHWI